MHPVIRFSSVLIPLIIALASIVYSAGINPHSASWLAGFYVTLFLFIRALKSAGKSEIHRAYSMYLSMLGLYLLAVWLLHAMVPGADPDATKKTVAFWTRILCIGSVYMPVTLFHFTIRFAGAKWRPLFWLEAIGWVLTCLFYATNITGSFIEDYKWAGVTWVPTMGGMYAYFFVMTSFYVSLGVLVPLVCIVRTDDRLRRLQLSYYLLGAIPLWVSCWGHFLISLGINIYPAGGTIFLLHAAIMAYAVFQHRVFDFTLVLRRALIYAALSAALGILYGAVVGAVLLFPTILAIGAHTQTIVFIVFAGFIFAPLHSYCQRLIDQLFYREQRNQQQILQNFAQETASSVDMKRIAGALCHCVDQGLRLKSVQLFMTDEKGRTALFARLENGIANFFDWPESEGLPAVITIDPARATIVQDVALSQSGSGNRGVLVTERNEHVVVPLKHGEQLSGCLLLGPKRADEPYSTDDLQFAEIIATYSAVALENGRSYLQLRQFQELTTQILDGLTTGLLLFDPAGKIISVNEAARYFFPEVLPFPQNVRELAKLQPVLASDIDAALNDSRAVSNRELTLQAQRQLSVLMSIRPLIHKNSSLFLLILHDISDYKEMEERSRNREHLAKLGETIASINHEIKNVVQPIRFQVETLKELHIDNSDFARCMSILPNRLNALDRLLNDLRDLARPLELRKMSIDVNNVLESVFRELKAMPNASQVDFKARVDAQAANCYADGHWLKLVFFNLLRNAAEATADRARPEVSVTVEAAELQTYIRIADNGCGIPENSLQKLFKPFFSTKGQAGNGLGLAISRKVIEQHGGSITVLSQPDVGTQFTIFIPQMAAATAQTNSVIEGR